MMMRMDGMGAGVKGAGGYSYELLDNGDFRVTGPDGRVAFAQKGSVPHQAISRELGMDVGIGDSPGRDEAAAEARLDASLMEQGAPDVVRLEERTQPTGPSFEPSGVVDEMMEADRLAQVPMSLDESIQSEEAALAQDLSEIDDLRMAQGRGGFSEDTVRGMEVSAREQAGIRPMRKVRSDMRKMERQENRMARRSGRGKKGGRSENELIALRRRALAAAFPEEG
jgi:hypothetical protein|tara:strand:- start:272 stop:946 length:675 start_codon:yes stop_codon:yes gene_type:complete